MWRHFPDFARLKIRVSVVRLRPCEIERLLKLAAFHATDLADDRAVASVMSSALAKPPQALCSRMPCMRPSTPRSIGAPLKHAQPVFPRDPISKARSRRITFGVTHRDRTREIKLWCGFARDVQLTPALGFREEPFVIKALRQSTTQGLFHVQVH